MSGNAAEGPEAAGKSHLSRRNFIRGSALAVGGVALYAGEIARHELSVVTQNLPIRNLQDAFVALRVAQISDIHFDEFTEPAFVRRVVAEINRLHPDLVLLTGDFISIGPLPKTYAEGAILRCLEILRGINAPRFACMGNHDSIIGAPVLRPIFASYDIPLLMNECVPFERDGQRLWISGVGEYLTEVANLDLAVPKRPEAPVLLMAHCPDYADAVVQHARGHLVDVMLSGHTHGGQVRIPLLPPMHLPLGGRKYVEGMFRLGQMQLYVNRGIGTVGAPFRLNCSPEIALFTLQRA